MVALPEQFRHQGTKPRSRRRRRDKCGAVVEVYDCDAYGNTLIFTGPGADGVWFTDDDVQSNYGASNIIYCGYRYDAETESHYVRNRYYSPVLGWWITRDPIGYEEGANVYGYTWGRPSGAVDGSGLGCVFPWLNYRGMMAAAVIAAVAAGITCRGAIVLEPEEGVDLAAILLCIGAEIGVLGTLDNLVVAFAGLIRCEKKGSCPDNTKIERQEKRLDHLQKEMNEIRQEIKRLRGRSRTYPPGTTAA